MNNAAVPNFKITGNPALDGMILKAIVGFATAIVTWALSKLNINDPAFMEYLTTAVIGVLIGAATFIYGWALSKVNQAKAVQAGVNLTVSGNALADNGTVISQNGSGTPPKAVTTQTAPQIVKNFATPN